MRWVTAGDSTVVTVTVGCCECVVEGGAVFMSLHVLLPACVYSSSGPSLSVETVSLPGDNTLTLTPGLCDKQTL